MEGTVLVLSILVELFPFNLEATFKLFPSNLPQTILSFRKASSYLSSCAYSISVKSFSPWAAMTLIWAGALGPVSWVKVGRSGTVSASHPRGVLSAETWLSAAPRAVRANPLWPRAGGCYAGCCWSALQQGCLPCLLSFAWEINHLVVGVKPCGSETSSLLLTGLCLRKDGTALYSWFAVECRSDFKVA